MGVDPQLERHSTSKLVSFISSGNVVGVDLALDVDVLIDSDVKELDSDQRLRVVHLQYQTKGKLSKNTDKSENISEFRLSID